MAKRPPIPFEAIARSALLVCESLLNSWLPGGKVQAGEYKVTNPLRADKKAGSFSINIRTGKWGDFATSDAGLDLISLYAYLNGLDNPHAAFEVADLIGYTLPEGCRPDDDQAKERKAPIIDPSTIKEAKPKEPNPWVPVVPVPSNAEQAPDAHPHRRFPAARWEYRDANGQLLGYVCRFNTSDGDKETIPLTYCRNEKTGKHEWRWKSWPEGERPLYGLDRLAEADPKAYVILVEGEKCADAALGQTKGVPMSWPGGSNAVEKADWSALAGRKIYAWPDCDAKREKLGKKEKDAGVDPLSKPLLPEHEQPGIKAMLAAKAILLALDPSTEFHICDIPKPLEKPDGWDIYDAINDDGFTPGQVLDFLMQERDYTPADAEGDAPSNVVPFKKKEKSTPDPADADKQERKPSWRDYLLTGKDDKLTPCLANIWDILQNDDRWKGVLAYDEFAQRVVKLKKPPFWNNAGELGEWDEQDDRHTVVWLTKIYRFSPGTPVVMEAVEHAAHSNTINPPKEWITSRKWDNIERLPTWMEKCMGVPVTEYTKRVATWFFMGMVQRILEPGCKFDYCLVLEGPQGRKKSTALAVIGGEWYGDTDLDLGNKDSMSALRGKILYEFSEMGSVAKAEATKQKSFLSRQIDEYRPVYGRREIRAPRSLVFAGTTNEWEWNKDPTGGRRFWPIEVLMQIDIDWLRENRDQLFAEAVARVKEGLRYWPTPEEQAAYFDKEQLKRIINESYVDGIEPHLRIQSTEFTLFHAATEWLKIDASKISRDIQTRIGNALRTLGCTRVEKRNNADRFWYKPPPKKAGDVDDRPQKGLDEDEPIPF